MTNEERETAERHASLHSAAWCVFYGTGIIFMLVIYGLLQERMMSKPYGPPSNPEMFQDSVFLVFCNRVVAVLFALVMVATSPQETFQNKAPLWKYMAISFSNVYASACQYEALKYVSFPVQMLGKSFKMMPVMLWGIAVAGKSYGIEDWLVAGAVTSGVTEFLMMGPISSASAESSSSVFGLLLLLAFLALDGFTSTFQEKLFKEHMTSKYNQMLFVNLGSCMISSGTLVATGSLSRAIHFAMEHHQFMIDAMTLSAAAVLGQWFIYSLVKEYGALVFAVTMNLRQVLSILASYYEYGHAIVPMQMLGLTVVFATLFYKSSAAMVAPAKPEKQALLEKIGDKGKKPNENAAKV